MSQKFNSTEREDSANGSLSSSSSFSSNSYNDGSILNDLNSLLECSVCFEFYNNILPPIIERKSGHLACSSCGTKLTRRCPTCHIILGNIKCLPEEEDITRSEGLQLKDSDYKSGQLSFIDKTSNLCSCPGKNCTWQGQLESIMSHLMISHKSIKKANGENILFIAKDITLHINIDWALIQSCFDQHFMLILKKEIRHDTYQFCAIVQLIGSYVEAENFLYRMELKINQRRLIWEAKPRSIHEGLSSFLSSDCFVFDASTAKSFAINGNLGINVTISHV